MLPINLIYAIFTEVSEAKEEKPFVSGWLDRNESTHQSLLVLEFILQRGRPRSPSLSESIQTRLILVFFFSCSEPSKLQHQPQATKKLKCTYNELCKFSYKSTKTGKTKTLYHTSNSVLTFSLASLRGLRNMYYGESIRKRDAWGKNVSNKEISLQNFHMAAATSFYFPKS